MAAKDDLSPITLSVVSGTLESTIREMSDIITRTARSVVIAIGRDFSATLFGHLSGVPIMVALGDDQPIHLGDLLLKVKEGATYFGSDIAPGDVVLQNDPASGGNHLPDISMYKPIFAEKKLIAWAAVTCHISDVGGPVPGGFNPDADSLFAEGLRIPHVKIVDSGRSREDVWNFIVSNVRTPETMRGDMGAMLSAVNTGEKRVVELCEKYGVATVQQCMQRLVERAEEASRAEIRSMPDGVYNGSAVMEGDGRETGDIKIECSLEIKGDEIYVDFSAPPQTKSDINAYKNNSMSAVYLAFVTSLSSDLPMNEGLYKPLHVNLGPVGTVINAAAPAACYTSTGPTYGLVFDAVTDALSKANPERACPGWSYVQVVSFNGVDPRDGEPFSYLSHFASEGGGGAYYGHDGGHMWGCISTAGASTTGDVELIEFRVPVHVRRLELFPDSGCPGKWRGGLGALLDVEVQCDDCLVTVTGAGSRFAPASRLGGGSRVGDENRVNRKWVQRPSGDMEELPLRAMATLQEGDRLVGQVGGGGAVGPPWERDLQAVEEDVRNGLVSPERARGEYGVVIDEPGLPADLDQTRTLREALLKQNRESE